MARAAMDWERRIGRRLRLRDLHILSTVVEHGSMAKAAAHLTVSQPAVSDAIANLEAALGVRLLDRSPHGVEPTIYADALLKRGHVVFDELRQGIRDIEFLADPTAGEVRVGCPESLAPVSSAIIDRLSRCNPGVVVHVTTVQPATLEFRELRERKVDLLLGRMISPSLVDDDIDVEILFEDRLFVVAGARNRWTRHQKIELAELANERWILLPENNALSSLFAQAFRARGLDPPRATVTGISICAFTCSRPGAFSQYFPPTSCNSSASAGRSKYCRSIWAFNRHPSGLFARCRRGDPVVREAKELWRRWLQLDIWADVSSGSRASDRGLAGRVRSPLSSERGRAEPADLRA
jgi:DNA-binding transcriptional LysR family regulator